MSNANIFKQFLQSQNLYAESWENENNTFFEFQQKLKTGPAGRLLIVFGGETLVTAYALDYVTLANPARKDYMIRLLNDLNAKYTYYKFYMDTNNNNIVLQCSLPLKNTFNPELVMNITVGALNALEDEYPELMKVMWS